MAQLRQKLSMWNNAGNRPTIVDDDDSWEVRAFAEDTSSAMGTTWPPRSYACNFCRREFRSAQALGGHMNIHRRDRARLQQSQHRPNRFPSSVSGGLSSPMFFSSPESIHSCTPLLDKVGMMRDINIKDNSYASTDDDMVAEDMDLELRLGW